MTHNSTVVMYSPDTIGLGHIRRHSNIAGELVANHPGANVVMLIGTGNGSFFELPTGVDSIKIPSVLKTGKDSWRARSLDLTSEATRRIRSGLIRETLHALRPAALLVDHLPGGIWGELIPVFQFLRDHSPHTKIVLGLRDILDDELEVRRRWRDDGTYDLIREYYDTILIYGDERVYPSAKRYGIDDSVCRDVRYMGYIGPRLRSGNAVEATESPNLSRIPGKKLMVVTAGGGHDAYPMMSSILSGLDAMPTDERPDSVLITGPLMPSDHREQLTIRAAATRTTIIPFTNTMKTFLRAADLIVTMGGYNSMIETLATGKPTINVPRTGPSQEQTIRARIFEDLGLLRHVPLPTATPTHMARVIGDELSKTATSNRVALAQDGARNAASRLASFLRLSQPMISDTQVQLEVAPHAAA